MDYELIDKELNIKMLLGLDSYIGTPSYFFKRNIEKYKLNKDTINNNQKEVIDEILTCANKYKDILKELNKSNIKYSLSLVGGSVRDLIVNKSEKINDFDFLLTCEDYQEKTIIEYCNKKQIALSYNETENIRKKANFKIDEENKHKVNSWGEQKDREIKAEIETETSKALFTKLISDIVKSKKLECTVFKEKHIEDKYLNNHIHSVIKIKNLTGSKRESDLIISSSIPWAFVCTFDFEICKGYVNMLKNGVDLFDLNSKGEFIKNMVCMPGMLRDIDEKTLTIKLNNFNSKHIDYFMGKHFLKLKEKFEDFKLNYYVKDTFKDVKENEIKLMEFYKLESNLKRLDNKKEVKIKI